MGRGHARCSGERDEDRRNAECFEGKSNSPALSPHGFESHGELAKAGVGNFQVKDLLGASARRLQGQATKPAAACIAWLGTV